GTLAAAVAGAVTVGMRPVNSAEQVVVAVGPERSVIVVAALGIVIVAVADPEHVIEEVVECIWPEHRAEPHREHAPPEEPVVPMSEELAVLVEIVSESVVRVLVMSQFAVREVMGRAKLSVVIDPVLRELGV